MQKKQIMIDFSKVLINVSKLLKGQIIKPTQTMSLGRLLLFFDYFIRQLYEPGLNLIGQIQYNLFNDEGSNSESGPGGSLPMPRHSHPVAPAASLSSPGKKLIRPKFSESCAPSTNSNNDLERSGGGHNSTSETMSEPPNSKPLPPSRIFCDCSVVEKMWESNLHSDDGPRPKFYNLISSEPNYQENPRLDGLAMNFLMNKTEATSVKDKVEYVALMNAILDLAQLSFQAGSDSGRHAEVYYVQYFLNRLQFGLPPPAEYLQELNESLACQEPNFLESQARVLYLIIWIPRLSHRIYSSWIRDILCKQGLTPGEAEALVKASSLNAKTIMKILTKAIDWIMVASQEAPSLKTCSLYFAIEAALNTGINCIGDISEEEELLYVMIRILEESLTAVQSTIIEDALKKQRGGADGNLSDNSAWRSSASHMISISSGFLMNNPIARIVAKSADPSLKAAMDDAVNEDFDSFPSWGGTEYKSDVIPVESHLLAVIEGHMSINQGITFYFFLCPAPA